MHPAFNPLRQEASALGVRLLAYCGGLAVLAVIAADLLSGGTVDAAVEPVRKSAWTQASKPNPAFSLNLPELPNKTVMYDIFRHADGSRRDVMGWTDASGRALATIEILRPGDEAVPFGSPQSAIAALAGLPSGERVQPAGVIATKFGNVPLVGFSPATDGDTRGCMGFATTFENPRLQIAGWLCQPAPQAAIRTTIGCAIDRLSLLSAGNDARVAELFARADLRRGQCAAGNAPAAPGDWITGLREPELRGRL